MRDRDDSGAKPVWNLYEQEHLGDLDLDGN